MVTSMNDVHMKSIDNPRQASLMNNFCVIDEQNQLMWKSLLIYEVTDFVSIRKIFLK